LGHLPFHLVFIGKIDHVGNPEWNGCHISCVYVSWDIMTLLRRPNALPPHHGQRLNIGVVAEFAWRNGCVTDSTNITIVLILIQLWANVCSLSYRIISMEVY
jgi:hypothetical protein